MRRGSTSTTCASRSTRSNSTCSPSVSHGSHDSMPSKVRPPAPPTPPPAPPRGGPGPGNKAPPAPPTPPPLPLAVLVERVRLEPPHGAEAAAHGLNARADPFERQCLPCREVVDGVVAQEGA